MHTLHIFPYKQCNAPSVKFEESSKSIKQNSGFYIKYNEVFFLIHINQFNFDAIFGQTWVSDGGIDLKLKRARSYSLIYILCSIPTFSAVRTVLLKQSLVYNELMCQWEA